MKKKTSDWLIVIGAAVFLVVFIVGSIIVNSDTDEVDLPAVSRAFETHVKSGNNSLSSFEAVVNSPSIYSGEGKIKTTMTNDGAVVGYKDKPPTGFQPKTDELVFKIEPDEERKRVIASNADGRRYSCLLYTSPSPRDS